MTTALDAHPDTTGRLSPVVPAFVPHPWLRSGHVQTIVGRYWPGPRVDLPSHPREVEVDGGDRLLVLDSTPKEWRPGQPLALFVHGLAGTSESPYVLRPAARLFRLGVRVVRMNLRGAGAGFGLARGIYHAGRTADLRRVCEWMTQPAEGSPLALVGYSLGANLVLKLAAEAASEPLDGFDCVLAANPPIDLDLCCRAILRRENRIYDRSFLRQLRKEIHRLHAAFPDLGPADLRKVATVYDFDHHYTAPRNGFSGASEYYARSSAGPLIPSIEAPGLVVHAKDDPFIPAETFHAIVFPDQLALEMISGGGHLGYLSHQRWMGDHRWLDGRFVAWLASRWSLSLN